MDGRDTAPSSGKGFIQELVDKMEELGIGQIATISGRYYAMVVITAGIVWKRLILR